MRLVVLGRGQGKTSHLIEWWSRAPLRRYIVVSDMQCVHGLVREISKRNLVMPSAWPEVTKTNTDQPMAEAFIFQHVIPASQVFTKLRGWTARESEVAIDELDAVLYVIFNSPVAIVTITPEEM